MQRIGDRQRATSRNRILILLTSIATLYTTERWCSVVSYCLVGKYGLPDLQHSRAHTHHQNQQGVFQCKTFLHFQIQRTRCGGLNNREPLADFKSDSLHCRGDITLASDLDTSGKSDNAVASFIGICAVLHAVLPGYSSSLLQRTTQCLQKFGVGPRT